MDSTSTSLRSNRGNANLDDILFNLSVNFLMYVVLIIVFYMLVRFYLEEETEEISRAQLGYAKVSQNEEDGTAELEMSTGTIEHDNEEIAKSPVNTEDEENAILEGARVKSPPRRARTGSFLNVNDWGEPEGTKQEVIQRAIFCAVGLIVSFCIWGLVQERILTKTYSGDFFEFSYGLVFLNRLGGLVLSMCLMVYFKVEWVSSPLWEYSFPAVANMLSSWCQYEALKYVSFPTHLCSAYTTPYYYVIRKFLNNKSYESYEYVSAASIGFGLYLFLDTSEHIDLKQNVFGDPGSVRGAWCGVVLLLLFLFFDSFTGQWQTRLFQVNKSLSPLQMMLIMNAFSAVFSFITLVHQEELTESLSFVYRHPEMIIHLVIFCICSTVGQLFIFYTVKNFGAVVFSIIMSTRILFSTMLSCFVYSHPITELGYLGMAIVFGAIIYRVKHQTAGKPLIRWRESEEAKDVFNEWHEHLDI